MLMKTNKHCGFVKVPNVEQICTSVIVVRLLLTVILIETRVKLIAGVLRINIPKKVLP